MINPLEAAQQARAGNQQVAPQVQAFGPQTTQALLQAQQLNTPTIGARIDGQNPIMVRQDPNFYAQQERDRVFTAMNQERQRMANADLQASAQQAATALQAQRDQAASVLQAQQDRAIGGRQDKTIKANIESATVYNQRAETAAKLANELRVKLQELIDKKAQGRLDADIDARIKDTKQRYDYQVDLAKTNHKHALDMYTEENADKIKAAELAEERRNNAAILYKTQEDDRIRRNYDLGLDLEDYKDTKARNTETWKNDEILKVKLADQARLDKQFAPLVGPALQAIDNYHRFNPVAHEQAEYKKLLTQAAIRTVTEEEVNKARGPLPQGQVGQSRLKLMANGQVNLEYVKYAQKALTARPEYGTIAGEAQKQAASNTRELHHQYAEARSKTLDSITKLGFSLDPSPITPAPTTSTPAGFSPTIPGAPAGATTPAGNPLTPTPGTPAPAGSPTPTPAPSASPLTPTTPTGTYQIPDPFDTLTAGGTPLPPPPMGNNTNNTSPEITRSEDESGLVNKRKGEAFAPQSGFIVDQSAEDGGLGFGFAPELMAKVPGALVEYPMVVAFAVALGVGSEVGFRGDAGKDWAEKQFQKEYDKLKGDDYKRTIKTGHRAGQQVTLAGAAKDQAVLRKTMEELAQKLEVELPKNKNGQPKFSQVGSNEFKESIAKIKKGFVSKWATGKGQKLFTSDKAKGKWLKGAKFVGVAGGIYGLAEAIKSQSSEQAVEYKEMLMLMNSLDAQQDDIEDARDQLRLQVLDIQDANDTNATNPLTP